MEAIEALTGVLTLVVVVVKGEEGAICCEVRRDAGGDACVEL